MQICKKNYYMLVFFLGVDFVSIVFEVCLMMFEVFNFLNNCFFVGDVFSVLLDFVLQFIWDFFCIMFVLVFILVVCRIFVNI